MRFILFLMFLFPFAAIANDKLDDVLNYSPATHQSLSFSLWSMNAYDVSNEEAIDAYLEISKCPVFLKYRDDDFIWQNIREGEKREIEYFADDYSNRFYIDALIALDRYDFKNSQFKLMEQFQFSDAGTIRFPFFSVSFPICQTKSNLYEKYFIKTCYFIINFSLNFLQHTICFSTVYRKSRGGDI